jgi:hypothetical protein
MNLSWYTPSTGTSLHKQQRRNDITENFVEKQENQVIQDLVVVFLLSKIHRISVSIRSVVADDVLYH